jgi:hypothetical protein
MTEPSSSGEEGSGRRAPQASVGRIEVGVALLGLTITLCALLLSNNQIALVGIVVTAVDVGMVIMRSFLG